MSDSGNLIGGVLATLLAARNGRRHGRAQGGRLPDYVDMRLRLVNDEKNAGFDHRRFSDLLRRPRVRYWAQCLRRGTILKKQERLQRKQAEAATRVAAATGRLARFDKTWSTPPVPIGASGKPTGVADV